LSRGRLSTLSLKTSNEKRLDRHRGELSLDKFSRLDT